MTDTTIGVAIDIPEPWGGELTAARLAAGDPIAEHVPAHVTLLGPTVVDAARLPAISAHLASVAAAHRPFTVRLSGTGTFRPLTQVVFVSVASGVLECSALHAEILAGFFPPTRFPYHPHVTIAHDVAPAQLDAALSDFSDFSCSFLVGGFTLFEHSAAGRWRPYAEYRLSADD